MCWRKSNNLKFVAEAHGIIKIYILYIYIYKYIYIYIYIYDVILDL